MPEFQFDPLLSTRSKVKKGAYARISPEGYVTNVIPQMPDCDVHILLAADIGASHNEYMVYTKPGQGTVSPFAAEEGIEAFVYMLEGNCTFRCGGNTYAAGPGHYLYSPPGVGFEFKNESGEDANFIVLKYRYIAAPGVPLPPVLFKHTDDIKKEICDGQENNVIQELVPNELPYDLQISVLTFYPGAHHAYLECHWQEHGVHCLSGMASYHFGDHWDLIKKGDTVWVAPYIPHGLYCLGDETFSYLYTRIVNRDPQL